MVGALGQVRDLVALVLRYGLGGSGQSFTTPFV